MQFRRRSSAVALVAAVIGSTLGQATSDATAATDAASNVKARTATRQVTPRPDDGTPGVWPKPQSLRHQGDFVAVTPTTTLVVAPGTDPYALDVIRRILTDAGARTVRESSASESGSDPGGPSPGLTVYAGGASAESVLRDLDAAPQGDLPSGGYRLAAGRRAERDVVALAGVGDDGLFHAAQTLRQLLVTFDDRPGFAGVVVRDWPTARIRGTAESFYGEPWTQAQRLAQLDFMGRTKQNRLLYAPGDDPYRQARWRDPYPAERRADFRALADRAARNHVTLAWAVEPGQALCFSSDADLKSLLRKVDAMWALGVRAFQVQFQDVSYSEWHCGADAEQFGRGPEAAARAQARLTNALAAHLTARYGADTAPLSLLPTEYYQDGATTYRTALATALRQDVQVAWTGVGVLPRTITGAQIADAVSTLRHPLLTVDNYPVNDFAPGRLFLGPYTGRDPAVATVSAGVLAAAMQQPAASRIPLFTVADYAWNPTSYDRQASWRAAIDDLAGPDEATRQALRALAGNDASSTLDGAESSYLRPLLADFWAAYEGASGAGSGPEPAAGRLRAAFGTMRSAPARLGGLADGSFGGEAGPWLDRLGRYGTAGEHAVDMLLAQARGDGPTAWRERQALDRLDGPGAQETAAVGGGVLDAFLDRARAASDAWSGLHTDTPKATTTMASADGTGPAAMVDGVDGTVWRADAPPQADDSFGVDLGTVRPVETVRIAMGGGSAAADHLHDAVLEYSAGDDAGWRRVGAYRDQETITARLPPGTRARYVRLRAVTAQAGAVSVREFAVGVPGPAEPVVMGGPGARAAADGDLSTAYRPVAGQGAPDGGTGAPGDRSVTVSWGEARPLEAVTVLTGPRTSRGPAGVVEAHLPARGWVRLGTPAADGWTEASARGTAAGGGRPLGADAVRVVFGPGSEAPQVHEIVPWFTGAPRLALDRLAVDAEVGGPAATVRAEMGSGLPTDVEATLEATPGTDGPRVRTPGAVPLRRGGQPVAPLDVSVPADRRPGTYRVPVRLTAEGRSTQQWLTVRAYPRTGGPDLARGGQAVSSGDETPDFPASALTDGDPRSRWSSPVDDRAWIRFELAKPSRPGRLVLHWQDAYAARYEIQASPDGRTWHTAATVRDGGGGTESVRLDAPDGTRYLRFQGVERATKYGYSLFGVEAYAVTP